MEGALQVCPRVDGVEQLAEPGPLGGRQHGACGVHQQKAARRGLWPQSEARGEPPAERVADEQRRTQAGCVPGDGLQQCPQPEIDRRRGQAMAGEIDDVDAMRAREGTQDPCPPGDRVAETVKDEQLRSAVFQ